MVFRCFKDDPFMDPRFYGWTPSKKVIEIFLKQRNRSKYLIRKVDSEEVAEIYYESLEEYTMIDFVEIPCKATGKKVKLLTTESELDETRKKVSRYFRYLCRFLDRPNVSMQLLNLYTMLDEFYLAALDYIGFRPPEIEAMFDSVEDYSDVANLNYWKRVIPGEKSISRSNVLGMTNIVKDSNQILYSLEGFMKVMAEDMI